MAKKNSKRKLVGMVCDNCNCRNYYTTKNTMHQQERLAQSKYCKMCRQHTDHKETKKNLGRNEVKARKS